FIIPSNTNVGNTLTVSLTPSTGVTNYYVIVDNGAGCSDNDTVEVTSNPLPTANAGNNVTVLIGSGIIIGGNPTGPAGSIFLWSPALGLNNVTSGNPIADPKITTTYKVIVTSAQGCTSIDSVVVTVTPTIVFTNGITPNGDGTNDEWIIDNIDQFPDCMVEVYNRWGELLFQSEGYQEKWNGSFKGKPLPIGTYYYIINLNDPLFPDAFTGPITILR
ncbi:MAG: gliding motility-associated C-terminal domain-containing protein, partial [Bacteroidetes bacterium]|nr:gliding motility-associated C-terminal domain-containing protein [Bacteroidota bacterium]